ncbi:MAG: START domain-containing protein [Flavobacteriales bacterium]|nr:START domain-containing protein [Flavobacteriales bacterium]
MKIYFAILLFAFSSKIIAQEGEWTLRKDQSGVRIYTQQTENSKLQRFKAVAEFNCPYESIVKVLRDYDKFEDWMYSLEEAEVLVNETDHDVLYQETDLPWPCDNRDVVMERFFKKTPKGMIIELEAQKGYKPLKDGVARMTYAVGSWEFTTLDNGKTKVVYQFLGDPGGQIPTWVVNLFLVDGPHKTLLKIRDRADC